MGHIVVGVDETPESAAALRWAVDEADARGWLVTAVLAWELLSQHRPSPSDAFDPSYGATDALAALDASIEAALGPERARQVSRRVVCDLPAHALLDAAQHADLLVVGTRELHGLRRVLTGSVSDRCVREAPCPVVVVHHGGGVQRRTRRHRASSRAG